MLTVHYAPGGADPVHRHNAAAFVYVLEGSIVMQLKGAEKVTLHAGQTFYEPPDGVHLVGRNASDTKPAKFLVFLVKKKGAPALVPVSENGSPGSAAPLLRAKHSSHNSTNMKAINPAENPKVEPHIRIFLKALNSGGGPPMETLTPAEARKVLVDAQASVALDFPPCDVEARTVTQDGLKVSLTIVRPAGSKATLPAFIFVHGGGWVLGDFPTHERFVRDLVVDSGCAAVFVNYTPSPEAHYPTAIHEIHAAAKWVAAHGDEIRVDGRRLAIAGNSVGGNMTAAVALMAKHQGGPAFKCQVMLWPVTDASFDTESYHEYSEGYFLSRAMMQWFWHAYAPDQSKRREIYASPLQATVEQMKGLPPALVQVAGNDVLRDEGLAYARKLDAAGVDVTTVRYENLIHDYGLLNAISQVPAVRDALHQAAEKLKKHLRQDSEE
jgi:acetyl esterase/lipase